MNAWQLLASQAPGNSGKKEALEYLNRKGESLIGIDLSSHLDANPNSSGPYFYNLKLEDATLENSALEKAVILSSEFINTNVTHADLSSISVSRSNFVEFKASGANLSNSSFTSSELVSAKFMGANLNDSLFFKTDLRDTDFAHSEVKRANFHKVNLSGSNLFLAKFHDTKLRDVSLVNANLEFTDLKRAMLVNVDFTEDESSLYDEKTCSILQKAFDWQHAVRDEAIACGERIPPTTSSTPDFNNKTLTDEDFSYGLLDRKEFIGSNLTNSNFDFARLKRAKFNDADLANVSFIAANLSEASFTDSNLVNAEFYEADLSGAYFLRVDFTEDPATLYDEKTCEKLRDSFNWHLAIRDEELACGKSIPSFPVLPLDD